MWLSELFGKLEANAARICWFVMWVTVPVFYVASFPPFSVNEAAFVSFVPFAIWLRFAPKLRAAFLNGFCMGWISWVVLIFWLHHVTWLGMLMLAAVMGAFFGLWCFGVAWISRMSTDLGRWSGVLVAVGAAAWWVVLEHARGWFLTGFPWLPLSTSQASEPIMLQGASIFGAWVVSFSLVLFNFGVAAYFVKLVEFARSRKSGLCPEFYVALAFLVATTFLMLRLSSGQNREHAFTAAVVQPNVPQDQKWETSFARGILTGLQEQTLAWKNWAPDAVFWPEAVLPYPINDDGVMESWSTRLATDVGAPIYAGALGIEGEDDYFNSVFMVRPEYGLFPLSYSKQHLVPFGEYIPQRSFWPWIEKVVPLDGDILPGEKSQLLPLNTESTTLQIGSLICFEDVFPGLARAAVKEGASILFVATNSAWYGKSGAAEQHKAHSILRAIETRRPVLRVGNDGWTGWIDEYGSVRDSLDKWVASGSTWKVSRDRRWVGQQTAYVKYGDWFVWVCWFFLVSSFVCLRWKSPRSKNVS